MEIKEYTKFRTDEILPLYTQVGWTAYTEDMAALEHGFQSSLLILAAYEKDTLLGLIRAVGDGATVILVQDILVYPEKQRQGIGQCAFDFVAAHCREHGVSSFVCHCVPQNLNARNFYQHMGGVVIGEDLGNEESWQDSLLYRFTLA